MVETGSSERTPLIRRRSQRGRSPSSGSAQARIVNLLQRARERNRGARESDTLREAGIDAVLKEIEEDGKKSSRFFWFATICIVNHLLGGVITLHFLEGWSFYDCFYFCIVTTTTVGYGDITPTTALSKVYVMYFIIFSIGLISTLLAYLIGLLLDQQEEMLLQSVVGDEMDEEPIEAVHVDEDLDVESGSQAEIIQRRILDATRRLDFSDYYGLCFSTGFLLIIVFLGFLMFHKMENLSIVDAMYTTIISATTVGFGDFEPTHNLTKVFTTIWLCFSTFAVAKVVADFTDASVKAKQRAVSRRLLTASMDRDTLHTMDVDGNGMVDKAEFVTEMLIRTGKVDRKEVNAILLRFQSLDKDSSGQIELSECQF